MARRPAPVRPPFLGELERAVMNHLWDDGAADVKAVHDAVGRPRDITLNTVQSTLKRLHEKGLLRREKVSHAFVYAPNSDRGAYHREALAEALGLLGAQEPDGMLAAFVDYTERAGPEHLEHLERLIAERLRGRGGK